MRDLSKLKHLQANAAEIKRMLMDHETGKNSYAPISEHLLNEELIRINESIKLIKSILK